LAHFTHTIEHNSPAKMTMVASEMRGRVLVCHRKGIGPPSRKCRILCSWNM